MAMMAASSLIAGCASPTKYNIEDMQDPATTPVEKWSDAMRYLDAMGITGMRDVPAELYSNSQPHAPDRAPSHGAFDAASFGLSAVSPPTGMSSGAAVGVGLGLLLLGGPMQPVQVTQIAAWVPSDMASSPEEAAQLVENKYNEAREKVFVKKLPQELSLTKYPAASALAFGKQFPKKENLVLFSDEAKESPWFLKSVSEKAYGPIYIIGHKVKEEAIINTEGFVNVEGNREILAKLSNALPEWFVIYDTAKSFSKKKKAAPVVLVGGKPNYFLGK